MPPSHQILVGDCIDMMRTLPNRSVQCCVTSPPYFGLRDYGVDVPINLAAATVEESGRFANMSRPEIVVTEKQSRQLEQFARTGIEAEPHLLQ